jgi:hypothetical protein
MRTMAICLATFTWLTATGCSAADPAESAAQVEQAACADGTHLGCQGTYDDPNSPTGCSCNRVIDCDGDTIVQHVACPYPPSTIYVTAATYGGNCGAPYDNALSALIDACNDHVGSCTYAIYYWVLGDPVPGCGKDFSVSWACIPGDGSNVRYLLATVPPEAGYGSPVTLSCPRA